MLLNEEFNSKCNMPLCSCVKCIEVNIYRQATYFIFNYLFIGILPVYIYTTGISCIHIGQKMLLNPDEFLMLNFIKSQLFLCFYITSRSSISHGCEAPCRCWDSISFPLKEGLVFLATKPSPQHQISYFFIMYHYTHTLICI